MSSQELQALRLINSGSRMTELGNVLVSRQAQNLLCAGLIQRAPQKWIAYELTTAGAVVLSHVR